MAKKALVIGISKFDHFSNLACDRDLERVSQWLRDQGYGVDVVPDRFERDALETQPSQAGRVSYDRLDEVLHRFLAETVRGCEMAVVYIASHGCIKHPSRTKTLACLAASDTPSDSNAG